MLQIDGWTALARALDSPLDPTLKRLLALRGDQLTEYDDESLVNFLIVEPGDRLADIAGAIGVAMIADEVDERPPDPPAFSLPIEWAADHGGWIEAPIVFSDDGAGVILLVQDHERVDANLLAFLRDRAEPSDELCTIAP